MFGIELWRLGRRDVPRRLRTAVALVLLLTLALQYRAAFPDQPLFTAERDTAVTPADGALFTGSLTVTILLVQAVALMLLTPAVMVGVFADRALWTLILVSPQSAWGFVLVRYFARLMTLVAGLLAGLPVLAVALVWGGVDPVRLTFTYAYMLSYVAAAGAISASIALEVSSFSRATGSSCAILFVVGLAGLCDFTGYQSLFTPLSPVGWILIASEQGWWAIMPIIINLIVAGAVLISFRRDLRSKILRRQAPVRPAPKHEARRNLGTTPVDSANADRPLLDQGDAFAWKESRGGGLLRIIERTEGVAGIAIGLLILVTAGVTGINVCLGLLCVGCGEDYGPNVPYIDAALGGWFMLFAMAIAGLRAAGSVTGERLRGTWEPLLVVPVARGRILAAKRGAALWTAWPVLAALAGCAGFAFLLQWALGAGGRPGLGFLGVMAFGVTAVRFGTSLGTLLSVRCHSTGSAAAWWVGALTAGVLLTGAADFGPVSAWVGLYETDPEKTAGFTWSAAFTVTSVVCDRLAVAGSPGRLT